MKIIGYLPLTFLVKDLGPNARHNLLFIKIKEGIEHFDSVLAQEKYEWWLITKFSILGAVIGIASFWLIDDQIAASLTTATLIIFPRLAFSFFGPLNRYMEIRGHAVEIRHAVDNYGADLEEKLKSEAVVMSKWYKSFKGMSVDEIIEEMRKHL